MLHKNILACNYTTILNIFFPNNFLLAKPWSTTSTILYRIQISVLFLNVVNEQPWNFCGNLHSSIEHHRLWELHLLQPVVESLFKSEAWTQKNSAVFIREDLEREPKGGFRKAADLQYAKDISGIILHS